MSAEAAAGATVEVEQPCIRCGYSLRGLAMTGRCPECGTPVERSFKGDLLIYSDGEYLNSLKRGAELVMVSLLCMVALALLPLALGLAGVRSAAYYTEFLNLGTAGLFLYGWWLLTMADPGQLGTNRGEGPRRLTRVAFIVALGIKGALLALNFTAPPDGSVQVAAGLASSIATAVGLFAGLRFVRWLTPRIPNPKAFKRARSLTTFLIVLMILSGVSLALMFGMTAVGKSGRAAGVPTGLAAISSGVLFMGCGGGIPALVALVMYYNLFSWLNTDFRNILRLQKEAGAIARPSGPRDGETPA